MWIQLGITHIYYYNWLCKCFYKTQTFLISFGTSFKTVCPRSLDTTYLVTVYNKWIKPSWTYSITIFILNVVVSPLKIVLLFPPYFRLFVYLFSLLSIDLVPWTVWSCKCPCLCKKSAIFEGKKRKRKDIILISSNRINLMAKVRIKHGSSCKQCAEGVEWIR